MAELVMAATDCSVSEGGKNEPFAQTFNTLGVKFALGRLGAMEGIVAGAATEEKTLAEVQWALCCLEVAQPRPIADQYPQLLMERARKARPCGDLCSFALLTNSKVKHSTCVWRLH
eukprot:418389-Amphidinium_carterae.2